MESGTQLKTVHICSVMLGGTFVWYPKTSDSQHTVKLDVARTGDALLAAEADITSGMINKSCINCLKT